MDFKPQDSAFTLSGASPLAKLLMIARDCWNLDPPMPASAISWLTALMTWSRKLKVTTNHKWAIYWRPAVYCRWPVGGSGRWTFPWWTQSFSSWKSRAAQPPPSVWSWTGGCSTWGSRGKGSHTGPPCPGKRRWGTADRQGWSCENDVTLGDLRFESIGARWAEPSERRAWALRRCAAKWRWTGWSERTASRCPAPSSSVRFARRPSAVASAQWEKDHLLLLFGYFYYFLIIF